MENFNNIPTSGQFGEIVNFVNANFSMAKIAIEQLQYKTDKNVGMYSSLSSLQAAVDEPQEGMWGTVATNGTFTAYTYNGTSWVAGESYTPSAGIYEVITNQEMSNVLM